MVEAFKVDVQEGDEAVIQPIGKRGQRIWKVNLFNKEGRQLSLQPPPLLTGEAEGMYSRK